MSEDSLVDFLAKAEMFSPFDRSELSKLVESAEVKNFDFDEDK